MRWLKLTLLLTMLLLGLFSCEGFMVKEEKHKWGGSISRLMAPLSGVAYADDGICMSTCTTSKCAHLIVHEDSSTQATVCSTNATTKYEFEFKEDPNTFYHGKVIEIKIVDANDSSKNRSKVEVIDSSAPVNNKAVDVSETVISAVVKGKLLAALDASTPDMKDVFDDYRAQTSISSINSALQRLTSTALLSDLNDPVAVGKAIKLLDKLDPQFLTSVTEKVAESAIESEMYDDLKARCEAKGTILHETTMSTGEPLCYVKTSSIASGNLELWDPSTEPPPPGNCTLNPAGTQYTCEVGTPPFVMFMMVPVATEPSNLADYTETMDWLSDNYQNNSCLVGGFRFGGFVMANWSLQDVNGNTFNSINSTPMMQIGGGFARINPQFNTFLVGEIYAKCLIDETSKAYCSSMIDDPAINQYLAQFSSTSYCY